MGYYLLIIFADLLLALNFASNKFYQKKMGTSAKAGLLFNTLVGAFTAIIFFISNGFKLNLSAFSLILAASMTLFTMLYTIVGFYVLKCGGMSVYTLFLMSGGMIVPYIWGLFYLNEEFSLIRTIGILIIVISIIISNFSKTNAPKKFYIMCIAVFLLNGGTSIVSKMHSIEKVYITVGEVDFIIIAAIIKMIISGLAFLLVRSTKKEKTNYSFIKVSLIVFACAIISGVSYYCQLLGAKELPATVLYPLITGGTIILSSLTEYIIFKEKQNKTVIISVVLAFIGTLMFL